MRWDRVCHFDGGYKSYLFLRETQDSSDSSSSAAAVSLLLGCSSLRGGHININVRVITLSVSGDYEELQDGHNAEINQ